MVTKLTIRISGIFLFGCEEEDEERERRRRQTVVCICSACRWSISLVKSAYKLPPRSHSGGRRQNERRKKRERMKREKREENHRRESREQEKKTVFPASQSMYT